MTHNSEGSKRFTAGMRMSSKKPNETGVEKVKEMPEIMESRPAQCDPEYQIWNGLA